MTASIPARRPVLLALGLLGLAGCTGPDDSDPTPAPGSAASEGGGTASSSGTGSAPADAPIAVADAWVKAAESGMTAAFATLTSTADVPMVLVGARSEAAPTLQLHETASDGSGGMSMQEKEGGFEIPAGGTLVLEPGGNHIMLLDLAEPLLAGDAVDIVLLFEGGAEVPFTAQIRDFAGAQEEYTSDMGGMGGASDGGGEHAGHEGMGR